MRTGRPKQLFDPRDLPAVEAAIASFGRDGRVLRKLLAIRSAMRATVAHAAAEHQLGRTTVVAACHAFRAQGLAGLRGHPPPGKPRRLTATQEALVRAWVVERRDRGGHERAWTLKRLAVEVQQAFGPHYTPAGLLRVLRRLGLSWKTGRPCHAKADAGQAAEFKKKSRY